MTHEQDTTRAESYHDGAILSLADDALALLARVLLLDLTLLGLEKEYVTQREMEKNRECERVSSLKMKRKGKIESYLDFARV